jgi:hypothetical protein
MATVGRPHLYVAISMLLSWMESLVINHGIYWVAGVDNTWDPPRLETVSIKDERLQEGRHWRRYTSGPP